MDGDPRRAARHDVERAASADFGLMMTSCPSTYMYALCFQTTITIKKGGPECGVKEMLWCVGNSARHVSPFTIFEFSQSRLTFEASHRTRFQYVVSLRIAICIFHIEFLNQVSAWKGELGTTPPWCRPETSISSRFSRSRSCGDP